jgi:hypothetical protein
MQVDINRLRLMGIVGLSLNWIVRLFLVVLYLSGFALGGPQVEVLAGFMVWSLGEAWIVRNAVRAPNTRRLRGLFVACLASSVITVTVPAIRLIDIRLLGTERALELAFGTAVRWLADGAGNPLVALVLLLAPVAGTWGLAVLRKVPQRHDSLST